MVNKAVMEMLRRPMKQAPVQHAVEMSGGAFHDRYLKELADEAKREATERMQLSLDAATARAIAAEKERDTLMGVIDSTGKQIDMLTLANTRLAIECDKESGAKDTAVAAGAKERARCASEETRAARLAGQVMELEKHNEALTKQMSSLIVANKVKPINVQPVKPIAVIPEFIVEVVSRDHNGAIKNLSLKPKK